MFKRFFAFFFVLVVIAPIAHAATEEDAVFTVDSVSDTYGVSGPVSMEYNAVTEQAIVHVDLESDSILWEAADVYRYPLQPFQLTMERDGEHVGVFSSYSVYAFDAIDGDYTIDIAYRSTETKSSVWYDRFHFTIDRSQYDTKEDYLVTVTQSVPDGLSDDFQTSYYYNQSANPYVSASNVTLENSDSTSFSAVQTYGGGSVYQFISQGEIELYDTRFFESGFDLYERRNNGWKIENISGENCSSELMFTAGPGLTTQCDIEYSFEKPYPDVIAANIDDMHIVKTIVVNGGDRSAQEIGETFVYGSSVGSFFGGVLPTDDIDGDAYRNVGRVVTGCGGAGSQCGYGDESGVLSVPEYPEYSISVTGTNCDASGYKTGEGIGLTECVFTYTHASLADIVEPVVQADIDIVGGPLTIGSVELTRCLGQVVSLDDDGKGDSGACFSGSWETFMDDDRFTVKVDDMYLWETDYEIEWSGDCHTSGSFSHARGYDGAEATDVSCVGTLTYIGEEEEGVGGLESECPQESDHDGDGWGWNGTTGCRVMHNDGSAHCIADGGIYNAELETCFPIVVEEQMTSCPPESDHDGDGWGWNGVAGCVVEHVEEEEVACYDWDGDGWGWNGTTGCKVSGEVAQSEEGSHSCPPESDHDGDGWGWNGTTGCMVESSENMQHIQCLADGGEYDMEEGVCVHTLMEEETHSCPPESDHDGDGWGWNGTTGCMVEQSTVDVEVACYDWDGDGWGWDGSGGCRIE